MKKIFVLLVAVLLLFCSFSGCKEPDFTVYPTAKEIEVKNSIGEQLKNNDNVVYAQLDMIGGHTCRIVYYKNGEGFYDELVVWDNYYYITNKNYSLEINDGKTISTISSNYNATAIDADFSVFVDSNDTSVTSETVDGKYIYYFKLPMTAQDVEDYASLWTMQVGDYMVTKATVDPDTLLVEQMDFYLQDKDDGSKNLIAMAMQGLNCNYEVPPEIVSALSGETYTVTVHFADEYTADYKVPKGASLSLVLKDTEGVYTDATGLTPYTVTEEPITSDLELYIK